MSEELLEHHTTESSEGPRNWREYISYPQALKISTANLLDTIASLIPLPEGEDKYVLISRWLEQARAQGIITNQEHLNLRSDIGPNL